MDNTFEITVSILEIGNAKIVYDRNTKDYKFNGKVPSSIPIDYYQELYQKFESNLLVQVRQEINVEMVETYIDKTREIISKLVSVSDGHRVNYLFSLKDNSLSDDAENTHDNITRIISTQKAVLNRVLLKLFDIRDYLKEKLINEEIKIDSTPDIEISTIPFNHTGKATFKINKKESLMLLFIMQHEGLIEFENEIQMKRFIENNFNYTETRPKSKDYKEVKSMIGVKSEFSKFKGLTKDELKSNNKTLDILLDRLNDTIHKFKFIVRKYNQV